MSDGESPPLRLKPRIRPESPVEALPPVPAETTANAGAMQERGEAEAIATAELPEISLPPVGNVPAEPVALDAIVEASPPEVPSSDLLLIQTDVVPESAAPASVPPPTVVPPEIAKLKLRANPAAAGTSVIAAALASAKPLTAGAELPRPSSDPALNALLIRPPAVAANPSSKPIHIRAGAPSPSLAAPALKPEQTRGFKIGVASLFIVVVVALSTAAYFGYRKIVNRPPPAPPTAIAKSAAPAADNATKGSLLARPAVSTAGKMIEKAQAVVAQRAQAGGVLDDVVSPTTPAASGASTSTVPPVTHDASPSSSSPASAHTSESAVSEAPDVLEPSVDLRAFVDTAKISGVFQGSPPRAIINGRTYRLGQTVDTTLGITLSKIDTGKKHIYFTEGTGAVVSRKY